MKNTAKHTSPRLFLPLLAVMAAMCLTLTGCQGNKGSSTSTAPTPDGGISSNPNASSIAKAQAAQQAQMAQRAQQMQQQAHAVDHPVH
jgi:hypothetical protein